MNLYTRNQIATRVVESESTIQCARASGNTETPAFFAQMAAPISKTIVRFDMERINQSPDLPRPTMAGQVVLKKTITMQESLLLPSGVDRLYSIAGEIVFGYQTPTNIGNADTTLTIPKAITDTKTLSQLPDNSLGSSNFVAGLIG